MCACVHMYVCEHVHAYTCRQSAQIKFLLVFLSDITIFVTIITNILYNAHLSAKCFKHFQLQSRQHAIHISYVILLTQVGSIIFNYTKGKQHK